MGLETGDIRASSGMSKAIYDKLNDLLSPPLEDMPAEDMEKIRDSWRKLAYAIADGVISHIKSNMEITGVNVAVNDVSTTVTTVTSCPAGAGTGTGTGSGTATGQQSNDGIGHVT